MLTRVDRLQMAVQDRAEVARHWQETLDAETESEDRLSCLGALRTTLRVGNGRVELLEPDGGGVIADAVGRRQAHLFAAGVCTPELDRLEAHMKETGASVKREGQQLFLDARDPAGFGMYIVVSPEESLESVGLLDFFYETTPLVQDAPAAVARCATLFGLDTGNFVPISSEEYGYDGTLTLFRANQLDRFEIITPNTTTKTMGRYFNKFSQSYYMAFAESSRLVKIAERVEAGGLGHTRVPPEPRDNLPSDTIFLHPPTLGGMMLGISRPTMAWEWSGQPEKVEPPA